MVSIRNVAILGASNKKERYAFQAFRELKDNGYTVYPVNPGLKEIEGIPVSPSLDRISVPIDLLTVYVGIERLKALIPEIIAFQPKRVILNPGTESPELKEALKKAGIPYVEACTLVLLSTSQLEEVWD